MLVNTAGIDAEPLYSEIFIGDDHSGHLGVVHIRGGSSRGQVRQTGPWLAGLLYLI
jgi:hypothetical protein